MPNIGERFKAHEIFLPDVLLAAKAMYAGMDQLKPLLIKEGISAFGDPSTMCSMVTRT